MKLSVDTIESVLRLVVPKPITVHVAQSMLDDEVVAQFVVTSYSQLAILNGLEAVNASEEAFIKIIDARSREMLLKLAEELERVARIAREATGQ